MPTPSASHLSPQSAPPRSQRQAHLESPRLDEALERIRRFAPESRRAGANHAPMVVEALCALGREDAIGPWLDGYERRLTPSPAGSQSPGTGGSGVSADPAGGPMDWRRELGKMSAHGLWLARFERMLEERPWHMVVSDWLPRLIPGLAAAAAHGWLRTAHAVRALAVVDTSPRRAALASGLAYWAARFQPLPEPSRRNGGSQPAATERLQLPADALATLPPVSLSRLRRAIPNLLIGTFVGGRSTSVQRALATLDLTESSPEFIRSMTRLCAGNFVANDRGFVPAVAFLHAVTATSALRIYQPLLEEAAGRAAQRHLWHLVAAWHAAFGPARGGLDLSDAPPDPESLVERSVEVAIRTTDPHLVKFTEACLREYAAQPDSILLHAADRAGEALSKRPT